MGVDVPESTRCAIERRFHEVIRNRIAEFGVHALPLPRIDPALNTKESESWFAVPGMYGGFHYWFEGEGEDATLVSESWNRIVGGSGQRHLITASEVTLVDQGFV